LIIERGITGKEITKIITQYRTTFERWQAKNMEVLRYEEEHNIETRWAPTSQEYRDALTVVTERKYRRAIDDLERLVVQRLFEMTKLGMSGVGMSLFPYPDELVFIELGYKLREKINKSLKARVDAIQSALKRYNEAAAQLNPPRSPLSWESVVNAVNVADFDLLRDTRQDIRSLDWAQVANREGTVLYFGIKRAKEEICRLNVEIRRVLTFLYDDYVDHYRAVCRYYLTNVSLAREISARWSYRQRLHEVIVKRLIQTSQLLGFSGSLFHGEREGRDPALRAGIPPPPWVTGLLKITEVVIEYEEEETADPASITGGDVDADTDVLIEILENFAVANHD
jgi:hypothetical protein